MGTAGAIGCGRVWGQDKNGRVRREGRVRNARRKPVKMRPLNIVIWASKSVIWGRKCVIWAWKNVIKKITIYPTTSNPLQLKGLWVLSKALVPFSLSGLLKQKSPGPITQPGRTVLFFSFQLPEGRNLRVSSVRDVSIDHLICHRIARSDQKFILNSLLALDALRYLFGPGLLGLCRNRSL